MSFTLDNGTCTAPTWNSTLSTTYSNATDQKTSTDKWGSDDADCGYVIEFANIDGTNTVSFAILTDAASKEISLMTTLISFMTIYIGS